MFEDRILFVDAEAIVIDKPAGLPVDQPRRGGDSVLGRIDELKLGFQRPPVPVHRLDQDTSGCLLLARNPKALKRFAQAFEASEVEKVYLAVVDGEIAGEQGMVDLPLKKVSSEAEGWRMIPDSEGKPAQTHWRKLAVRGGRALVELRPQTGRTHQLRVHALHGLRAPIVGDPIYGDSRGTLMLHAVRIVMPRDRKPSIDVSAPLPPLFSDWADAA